MLAAGDAWPPCTRAATLADAARPRAASATRDARHFARTVKFARSVLSVAPSMWP
jgi:hypothetical protein